ncbi:MAG TPA: hypothetical protein ENG53_01370 [Firmicutes bacterium]|nr:hypothetical protein [Bacillota bacterium]
MPLKYSDPKGKKAVIVRKKRITIPTELAWTMVQLLREASDKARSILDRFERWITPYEKSGIYYYPMYVRAVLESRLKKVS